MTALGQSIGTTKAHLTEHSFSAPPRPPLRPPAQNTSEHESAEWPMKERLRMSLNKTAPMVESYCVQPIIAAAGSDPKSVRIPGIVEDTQRTGQSRHR